MVFRFHPSSVFFLFSIAARHRWFFTDLAFFGKTDPIGHVYTSLWVSGLFLEHGVKIGNTIAHPFPLIHGLSRRATRP